MVSESDLGKREEEREHLALFLDAYRHATGETFPELYDSETPDFLGCDREGRVVGIEITQLRFAPDERHMRDDTDAFFRLLRLLHQKDQKLTSGAWPRCKRKILVIMNIHAEFDSVILGTDTDRPDEDGFDEVWLADHTQVEALGGVDIYAVVHPHLEGRFATADIGAKNPAVDAPLTSES
jgi:hypothetical protein